jgi:hypothetical protein
LHLSGAIDACSAAIIGWGSLYATFGPKIFRHTSRMIVYLIGK